MPRNIEIKARARDFDAALQRAETLSGAPCQIIEQTDVFFRVAEGRLKLRTLAPDRGELIFYDRPDSVGPKTSLYRISQTSEPAALEALLARALGVLGVVRKTRRLCRVGQTRVHLDDVVGLGRFLELEVVLHEGQSTEDGAAIARDLMREIGVAREDWLEGAYLDLLPASQPPTGDPPRI